MVHVSLKEILYESFCIELGRDCRDHPLNSKRSKCVFGSGVSLKAVKRVCGVVDFSLSCCELLTRASGAAAQTTHLLPSFYCRRYAVLQDGSNMDVTDNRQCVLTHRTHCRLCSLCLFDSYRYSCWVLHTCLI
jgi:hypothetical protein